MIEKVGITTNTQPQTELEKSILRVFNGVATKLNEIIDAVNAIQKEREAERFEIQEWIGILEAVRKSVNVHEKQIDELQMKAEPEKCEIPADNSEKANCQENVQPDYVTTTYVTDGHTKEYYGQNGASIVTDNPLPAGYLITIREPETKGGDNE